MSEVGKYRCTYDPKKKYVSCQYSLCVALGDHKCREHFMVSQVLNRRQACWTIFLPTPTFVFNGMLIISTRRCFQQKAEFLPYLINHSMCPSLMQAKNSKKACVIQ